jgi:type IX secretion system PorP/SprF family membrane protein
LKKYAHIFYIVICIGLYVTKIQAQDIHFSQYYNNPLQFNPAQAGLFAEDTRFIFNNRWQSMSVPVSYKTFAASFDHKVQQRKNTKGIFVNGGLLSYDRSGDANLSTTHIASNMAYIKRIGELNLLSIGLQAGLRHRGVDYGDLYFDKQFDGEVFNPKRSTGEQLDRNGFFSIDFGIGLNYRFQLKDKRTRLDFGAAIFHPHEPLADFMAASLRLPSRKTYYVLTNVKAGKKMDVVFNIAGMGQGPYNEFYISHLYKIYLQQTKYKTQALQIGVQFRMAERRDAIIPTVEFLTNRYRVGFSYDITLSPFVAANQGRGGPELSLQYLITNVKKIKSSKSCQVF